MEHDELDIFLRLKEEWNPSIDEDRPPPEVKPVGIPGASSPLQMTPDHLKSKMFPKSPAPSPLKGKSIPVNKRVGELDMGDELGGYGLQGVKVTEDELRDLIAELGLDGDEAGDLASGLKDITTPPVKGLNTIKKKPKDIANAEATPTKEEIVEKVESDPLPETVEPKADDKTEDKKTDVEEAKETQPNETEPPVVAPVSESVAAKE